ncbi:cytochrome P450 [Alteriqipengyuania sp. 357]
MTTVSANLAKLRRDAPPLIDPPALMGNPHASFHMLRETHPLIRLGDHRLMALRARDVATLLTDPDVKQIEGRDYAALQQLPDGPTRDFFTDVFLFSNGKTHRTARGLFARSFSLGNIRARKGDIRAVADRIVRQLPREEPFDFVDLMAARVPSEMIAGLLGLDVTDTPQFSHLVYTLSRGLNPVYPHHLHAEIDAAVGDLYNYVAQHLRQRLDHPTGDLLSQTAATWAEDDALPFAYLVHQVMGMIVGGVDTTRASFAIMVSLLLQHDRQWQAVRNDRSLIPGAVSEALRYEPSVASITRVPVKPISLCGYDIAPGQAISVNTMSAMRDPDAYADPDRFDIRRQDHPRLHPVFGQGPHHCIGEVLARFEMEEALAALIEAVPHIELLEPPRMIGFGGLRQITEMTVWIA